MDELSNRGGTVVTSKPLHGIPSATSPINLDVFISAGDASGDLNGAEVVNELRGLVPHLRVRGLGGPCLGGAGVDLIFDSSQWSVIGPVEGAKRIPSLWWSFQKVKRVLCADPPDLVVPIDFGGYNVRLARFAKNHGLPVLYYFPPRSWAKEGKIGLGLAEVTTKIATPFEWSAKRLSAAGAEVEFVGHPAVDRARPSAPVSQLRQEFCLPPEDPVISVFPGSRVPEIKQILPVILKACERVQETGRKVSFLFSRSLNLPEELYRRIFSRHSITPVLVTGRVYDLMALAQVGITVSGTVTLEAACSGMPMVIVYTGPWLGRTLWRVFMNLPMVGMPNLLLNGMVAPELICDNLNPKALGDQVLRLLDNL
ncbi:MAG: hypothetical protein HY318_11460, partial [Armatimonadetes bacterium]|nr:hypothetical protein [Armatimonadota bacterium]